MGRGRAKAKQTKVARDLKYSSPQTDFERLQKELAGSDGASAAPSSNGFDHSGDDEDDWRP
jgi:hypothetical protein